MKALLNDRASQLARLTMMIKIGLETAEAAIPGINGQLAELADLGVTNFQIEGPAVYCRPAGLSSDFDDSVVVYQAIIIPPGGIGSALWDGGDIRLISFITQPETIRKILTHLGEQLELAPVSPVRGPPVDWDDLVQADDDSSLHQASPEDVLMIDIHRR